jgi:transglutaminase-like putative cysteine protease
MKLNQLEKKATSKTYKLYVAIVVTINIVPHCFYLPTWLILIAAIFIIWSILNIYREVRLPSVAFRNILTVIASGLIFINYKTFMGPEPAAAIFVIIASVKLVDFTKYRDGMTEIFICYFLLLMQLLQSQSIGTTLFFTIDIFIITTLMHQLHKNDRRQTIRTFLPSLKLLFLALPIWIFLFLVFPRFSASIFQLKAPQAAVGFSEQLVPGAISKLIQSDETAFRVKFDHMISNDNLYFRGAVLSENMGLTWKKSAVDDLSEKQTERSPLTPPTNQIKQEIILEPLFQKFIFVLDYPTAVSVQLPLQTFHKTGGIYELNQRLQNRAIIHAASSSEDLERLPLDRRSNYLKSPQLNPQVLKLAEDLAEGAVTARQKVGHILQYFSKEHFAYTLEPGAMSGDALSIFLFQKKIGFCEHYAASLAALSRLMNLPSRVVIGFQGGRLNELTGYFLVKTLDAHAWAEVWSDEEQKWMRVDPTAVVAPLRIALGGEFNRPGFNSKNASDSQNSVTQKLQSDVLFAIDAITTKWNNFLLKYDFEYQNKLLEELGFSNSSRMTLFVLLFTGLAALMAVLKIYFGSLRSKIDPTLEIYHQFCTKLERMGVSRNQSEGPLELLHRATAKLPEKAELIAQILGEFIAIRYESRKDQVQLKSLKKLVHKFY